MRALFDKQWFLVAVAFVISAVVVFAAVTSSTVVQNFDQNLYAQYLKDTANSPDEIITDSELWKLENKALLLPAASVTLGFDGGIKFLNSRQII